MNTSPFRSCNPLYGYRWISEGLRLFLRQPWPWLALVGFTMLTLLLLSFLPLLGIATIFVFFPCIVAGFLIASRDASTGGVLHFGHLRAGCKTRPKPLFLTGALAFAAFFAVLTFLTIGWREQFMAFLKLWQSQTADQQALLRAINDLTAPTLIFLAAQVLIAIFMWFAPALIVFQNYSARAAILTSARAWLANFAPFLVFGVLLFVAYVLMGYVLRLLLGMAHAVGGEQAVGVAGMLLSFPVVCGFFAVLLAAAYISYMDVFESARAVQEKVASAEVDMATTAATETHTRPD